ncbi:hypothetical protein AAZX31_05G220400 [Glycine max]
MGVWKEKEKGRAIIFRLVSFSFFESSKGQKHKKEYFISSFDLSLDTLTSDINRSSSHSITHFS